MRSQNCLDLRPKIVMPTKIHPSLLGDWNPLSHQLNLIDQVQPLEKEAIEIISGMVTQPVRFCGPFLRKALNRFMIKSSILFHEKSETTIKNVVRNVFVQTMMKQPPK